MESCMFCGNSFRENGIEECYVKMVLNKDGKWQEPELEYIEYRCRGCGVNIAYESITHIIAEAHNHG